MFIVTLLAAFAPARETSTNKDQGWRGSWVATAGPRTFHGRWSAQLSAKTQDAVTGSWTLLSDSNQILLEGTWSARKSATGWQGTWSARVNSGRPFSGSWSSDLMEGKTFEDLLKQTIDKQVTGSWRSGRMLGNWWLMGPR
jgi:hypothetical protein